MHGTVNNLLVLEELLQASRYTLEVVLEELSQASRYTLEVMFTILHVHPKSVFQIVHI